MASLLQLIDLLAAEENMFTSRIAEQLRDHCGYRVIQQTARHRRQARGGARRRDR
ncbi:hypothetical protein [Streptomyces sp. TRM70350]|uniref:hypothetical protein n=1 Tax=Streptomyces sp. TRM70350 TaxID=2856165 RepID=UPI001C46FB6D|nr:hypothetical protein [Streptomyces sp. TRM70350]MBV7697776.1 hypothetical protein [Streptomyces sp. TRM70350]